MNKFLEGISYNANYSTTENGAKGYSTTHNPILDMSFKIPSYRTDENFSYVSEFREAMNFNTEYAIKFLFYLRDVRQGVGERRTFRTLLFEQGKEHPEVYRKLLKLVPEYGRWDDLFVLLKSNHPLEKDVMQMIKDQIAEDRKNAAAGKPISLLGKWLPSEQASSSHVTVMSKFIREQLGMTAKSYRKMLSGMRRYLKVVEKKMSAGEWGTINYAEVPSKANRNYSKAFLRHDYDRRVGFIDDAKEGRVKVNSAALFPYEVIKPLMPYNCFWDRTVDRSSVPEDDIIVQWKNLPNLMKDGESTLVVMDGSASMTATVGRTGTSALTIAMSLALYCAEKLPDEYKDKVITFSANPQYLDFSNCNNIVDKVYKLSEYDEVSHTDIEKVFDLVLRTAEENNLPQEELPSNILIISDMEFDQSLAYNRPDDDHLFKIIENKYRRAGYKLPKLIFWNVNSRTNTIPTYKENVTLVSGFSQNLLKTALGTGLTPWEALQETLDSERYQPVQDILNTI